MQPSMVTHILNLCSAFSHPKRTNTAVNTPTINTHLEQWAAIYTAAHMEQLGVEKSLVKGESNSLTIRPRLPATYLTIMYLPDKFLPLSM